MKILLVDDHALTTWGIEQVLGKNFQIVGKATNSREALALWEAQQPEIIILDLAIPSDTGEEDDVAVGLELLGRIKERAPQTRVLVYTSIHARTEPAILSRTREAGAAGFVNKGEPPERLLEAVDLVAQGRLALTLAQDDTIRSFQGWERTRPRLSPRERIILLKMRDGLSAKEIARQLGNRESTIKKHIQNIHKKLDAQNQREALKNAEEWGLL